MSPDENASLEDEGVKKSQDLAVIQQVIAVKDKFRISDEALHELHMIGSIIPSKSAINTEKIPSQHNSWNNEPSNSKYKYHAFLCVDHCFIILSFEYQFLETDRS